MTKARKFKKSCRIISIATSIAHSTKRSPKERYGDLKDLREYIDSLMESVMRPQPGATDAP